MKILTAWIILYLAGSLTFLVGAWFDYYHEWDAAYYLWASIAHGGLFSWWSIYSITKDRSVVLPIALYATIVSAWEVASLIAGIDINHPAAVFGCFIALLMVFTYLLWSALRPREK